MDKFKEYDFVGAIIAYEDGSMDIDGVIEFFQYMIDTGKIDHLQGSYGRSSKQLLDEGLIVMR